MLHVLSLGAGVQSSTLALMISTGFLKLPIDFALFSDTGDEPEEVYRWLAILEKLLPFPVYRVSAGTLSAEATKVKTTKDGKRSYLAPAIPVYIENENGGDGMWQRQCTRQFKIDPIYKFLRKKAEVPRGCKETRVTVYVGISLDEAIRMKPSPMSWVENKWPLVDAGIRRLDCLRWMESNGYPTPPRSACYYCPYHSDAEWIRLKEQDPESFQKAIALEKKLQASFDAASQLSGVPYLHASRVPLGEVDFDSAKKQQDLFGNECEGMCGV